MSRTSLFLLIALSFLCASCGSKDPAAAQKAAPPAKVESSGKESDLGKVTLTPQAEERLGIRTAPVEFRRVVRSRTFGGEVTVPPGGLIRISAPLSGTVTGAENLPLAGSTIRKGQVLVRLVPFLPPERDLRVLAEKDVASREARLRTAQARSSRAQQMLRDKAGSVRAAEEASEELAVAEAELKAARAHLDRLDKSVFEAENGVVISSPQEGVLQQVHIGPGQTVAAGGILFELAKLNPMWIRVPIYVGDLASIERKQTAKVHAPGEPPGAAARIAQAVSAPPSADSVAASADLFFTLPNDDGALRPGQKVGVTLTLRGAGEQSLVVPWSAVLHDYNGGTWVYENSAPQVFVRRRIEVRHVLGGDAVLARGPAAGTKVVVTGAAEIFGTEFGTGK